MPTTYRTSTDELRPSPFATGYVWPRWINIALGAWLAISAALWPQTPSSATNTLIVGLVVTGAAAIGLWVPSFRWVNAASALWLFISAFALPHAVPVAAWNNAVTAILVFVVSLMPSVSLSAVRLHRRAA